MIKKAPIIFSIFMALTIIATPILGSLILSPEQASDSDELYNLNIWQIDGFEGGKGSRKSYIENAAKECFKKSATYCTVTALSSETARQNIENGIKPDIISYNAGFYGIEEIINCTDYVYQTWCSGAYCLISLNSDTDFSAATADNTVLNVGKDNLAEVTATLCGLHGAQAEEPTNAYLKLIDGKYEFMLGTQRDVFRFKTRQIACYVKPVTQFNDLYQHISIITNDNKRYKECKRLISYLIDNSEDADRLGLYGGGQSAEEALNKIYGLNYEKALTGPCSKNYVEELRAAATSGDINKLKYLLK